MYGAHGRRRKAMCRLRAHRPLSNVPVAQDRHCVLEEVWLEDFVGQADKGQVKERVQRRVFQALRLRKGRQDVQAARTARG